MGKVIRFKRKGRGGENDATWMLGGLGGLAVVIEDIDANAVDAGVNRTIVQQHLERSLAEKGIPIGPLAAAAEDESMAILYVAIDTDRDSSSAIALLVSFQLCETAALVRDPDRSGGVTTWTINGVWVSTLSDLERDVLWALDEGAAHLAREYNAAQP